MSPSAATELRLDGHLDALLRADPDAPAVEFERRWFPWRALLAFHEALSAALDRASLGAGAPVGVVLRNRPEHVATVVSLLASRRCVVTVNAVQGDERLARELASLALPAVVINEADYERPGVADGIAAGGSLGVVVGGPEATLARLVAGDPRDWQPRPGVAIELLTSGTTGPPKRVDLPYAGLERALLSAKAYETSSREVRPTPRASVAVLHSPLVHVSGIWRLLEALVAGRRIALAERFTVESWLDTLRRHQPRTTSLVPAALRMVYDADLDPAELSSLRAVVTGTAAVDPALAEAFEDRYGVPVLAVYGATEFAGGVAGWTVADRRAYRDAKRGSVGRANPGVELRVVREDGTPVDTGAVGVLEVRAPQVGTDDWLRTTDLASLDDDGFLFLHGRTDDVIVRGGFKVSPSTIEDALSEHESVAAACAVGVPDEVLGAVPAAVVKLVPGASASEEELREFAAGRLVGYQVPVRVVIVDELPRTASLKASRYEAQGVVLQAMARSGTGPERPGARRAPGAGAMSEQGERGPSGPVPGGHQEREP